ncbi:MAG: VWA domain-containing protein [Candidatus Krumholzibacteria bacterium]|nr:VWA domain-containing protein [Candidatus Krumholzibacteria bacterium]
MARRTKKSESNGSCTHIAVILDRTGSMETIRDDTIGGFNSFLEGQQAGKGKATMTLVQFDGRDPYEVIHRFRPVGEIEPLTRETYVPRANTPLYDALGRGINDLGASLAGLAPRSRPKKVIFAVVTDGQENASGEFTREQVEALIREKKEEDGWQFVFLSADLAAIGDAVSVGIDRDSAMLFDKDAEGSRRAWGALACAMTDLRADRVKKIRFAK